MATISPRWTSIDTSENSSSEAAAVQRMAGWPATMVADRAGRATSLMWRPTMASIIEARSVSATLASSATLPSRRTWTRSAMVVTSSRRWVM